MTTQYVEVAELPATLQRALKAVGYDRTDISMQASESYTPAGGSGQGQRRFVMAVNLATGERQEHWGSWGGANMFNPTNAVDLDTSERPIDPGFAVIEGNQGEKTYAYLRLHPSNVVALLPPKCELSERQLALLDVYAGLNSRGRKEYFDRRPKSVPTEDELAELVALGVITRNKAGAVTVTTKGRNSRSGKVMFP